MMPGFGGATYLCPPSAGLPVCRLPSDDLEFVLGLSEGREPEFCVDTLPEGLFATGPELTVEEAMVRLKCRKKRSSRRVVLCTTESLSELSDRS